MTDALYGFMWLAGGCLATWIAWYMNSEFRKKRHWPTVSGNILERGLGDIIASKGGPSYIPYVKYSYTVAGKEYVNDQVYLIPRQGVGGADFTQRFVDALPDPVPVHYDPDDPSRSYLLLNPRFLFWLAVAFAVGAFLLGFLQLLTVIMKKVDA